jgi:hypothetical protein
MQSLDPLEQAPRQGGVLDSPLLLWAERPSVGRRRGASCNPFVSRPARRKRCADNQPIASGFLRIESACFLHTYVAQ